MITLRNHLPAIQPKAHSLTITPKVLKKLLDLGRFDRRALINCLQVKNKKSQNGGCFKCKLIQIKKTDEFQEVAEKCSSYKGHDHEECVKAD